jgi:predicted flap endonuclease-1-like 5' DNA nuclease
MWEETLKRWIDLFFWWLPKQEQPGADATEQADRSPAQAAAEPVASEQVAPEPADPKPAATKPAATKPAATKPAAAKPAADTAATATSAADDLTVIKGIGPVVQEKLQALGIRTFGDLAAADPQTLTGQLKGRQPISEALVRGWTEAADQRAGPRH